MKIIAPFGSDMVSGSYGSITIARNRGGLYIRSRAVPTNPGSPAQVAQRSYLSFASQSWRDLSADDKADWNTWAGNNPIRGRLGDEIILSGQQAFVLLNTRILGNGSPIITEPPVDPAPAPLLTLSMAEGVGPPTTLDLVFTATPLIAGNFLIVRAAKVNSTGISYIKNKLVLLVREEAAASPFDIKDLVQARLGTLSTGEVVHVDVAVSGENMQYSGSLLASHEMA